jgi:hypothetical protein
LRTLTYHTTRLQTFVVMPSALAMFVLAPAFLHVWLGGSGVSEQTISDAIVLARIMILGFVAKCMLDVWWRLLYGAGHVRPYVQLVVAAALITPLVSLALLWLLPDSIRFCGPAIGFASVHAAAHLGILPLIVIRRFHMPYASLLIAMARPLIPAALAGAAALAVQSLIAGPNIASLLIVGAIFATTYLAIASVVAFEAGDRARLVAIMRHARNMLMGAPEGDSTAP